MPYVPGGGAQKDSGLNAVGDVYYATNVYANNVKIALWQTPGESEAFAKDAPAAAIAPQDLNSAAVVSPSSLPAQTIPRDAVANGMVEESYSGTATAELTTVTGVGGAVPSGTVTPQPAPSGQLVVDPNPPSGDPVELGIWLKERLDEGKRGVWNRVSPPATGKNAGPAINPGNQNIIGMWRSIGLTNFTNNDQTAWCMGWINFGLKQCGYKWCPEASSWAIRNNPGKWGATQVPLNQGQTGDIALFSFGHVAFVYQANNGTYSFVGGNQTQTGTGSDRNPSGSCVSESWAAASGPVCSPSRYSNAALVGLWRPAKA